MGQYLITGATGYIGSMLVERLLGEGMDVSVIVRKPERLREDFYNRIKVIKADIRDSESLGRLTGSYDFLIHCAAPTQSSYMMSNPVEVADTIVNGTKNMLSLSMRARVQSMVYLSSMEVYGKVDGRGGRRVSEEELGELDLSNIRSCYPMAKRMAENFCHLYHLEYGVPVRIARLAQTFGRGVSPGDNRVFAQMARAVRDKKDIILHTNGNSAGNYCDIDDALDALLLLAQKGCSGGVYNIVNEENTMTIGEMAKLVAENVAGGKIDVKYEIEPEEKYGYAPETGLRLSAAGMRALGWEAKTGLDTMYRSMISGFKSS